MKTKAAILFLVVCSIVSCGEKSADEQNEDLTSENISVESRFVQQSVVYFEVYKSGDADKALQAMLDDVLHTTNAKESDLSAFWKNQALAFSKTRISMILRFLGRDDQAQAHLTSALDHINQWLKEGGRERIDEKQLISNVVAADKAHKDLPWHPKID